MEELEASMDTKIDLSIRQNNANWENRIATLKTFMVRQSENQRGTPQAEDLPRESRQGPPEEPLQSFSNAPQLFAPHPRPTANPIRGEKQKNTRTSNNAKYDNPMYTKPKKFSSKEHEIQWELSEHKKKVIIRVERADFVDHIEGFKEEMSNEELFKIL